MDERHQRQVAWLVTYCGLPPERAAAMLDNCPADRRGRYLVFAYDCYYPSGGLDDVAFDSDSRDDAMEAARRLRNDTIVVYDRIEDSEEMAR